MRLHGIGLALLCTLLAACSAAPALESKPRLQPPASGGAPTGAAPEAARPLQKLSIGTSGPSLSWLPAQLAWTLGYFREEGLEPEFVQVGGPSVVPALLGGELHFTTVLSAVGANAGQGGETRVVQFHSIRLQHVLSVRPEITAIQQLSGKRVAVQSLGTLTAFEAVKIAEHFNLADVAVIAVGGDLERIAAMESGAADANIAAIPMNIVAEKRGFPGLLRISSILEIPQAGFGTSVATLRDRADLVARGLRGAARAFPVVTGQPDVVRDSIREFMALSPEDAARAYDMVADTFSPNGVPTDAQMAAYLALLRSTGGTPDTIGPDQIADFTLARRVAAELGLPAP